MGKRVTEPTCGKMGKKVTKQREMKGSHFRWEGDGSMTPTGLTHAGLLNPSLGQRATFSLEWMFHKGSPYDRA